MVVFRVLFLSLLFSSIGRCADDYSDDQKGRVFLIHVKNNHAQQFCADMLKNYDGDLTAWRRARKRFGESDEGPFYDQYKGSQRLIEVLNEVCGEFEGQCSLFKNEMVPEGAIVQLETCEWICLKDIKKACKKSPYVETVQIGELEEYQYHEIQNEHNEDDFLNSNESLDVCRCAVM